MVVTQSIVSAIRYYRAITRQLEAVGNPFKVLIAFSGSKEVDGVSTLRLSSTALPGRYPRQV